MSMVLHPSSTIPQRFAIQFVHHAVADIHFGAAATTHEPTHSTITLTCLQFGDTLTTLSPSPAGAGTGDPGFGGVSPFSKVKGKLFGPSPSANLVGVEG